MKRDASFLTPAYLLFYGLKPHFLFPIYQETDFFLKRDLNITSKDFEMDSPQILSIRVLIISGI